MKHPAILIAEDDEEDRMIISGSFSELKDPLSFHFVNNGQEVIEYLATQAAETLPELIILDLNMPRMNGTETLRALKNREAFAEIPVMIFSTSVNEIEKNECLKLGAADYLTKPSTYNEGVAIASYFSEFARK